ncbi:LysR family transcriptional regulator [Burkholderia sp. JKS000303]|uniref:LysR family transcriptional regulator n=1 Tax=Burkholderia sp. JKS000303 TaxID=1938747 RepID=UPI000BF56542|nr:LysR family transcriptional regulator [Burkholderia sp. JKS000303]PFH19530.1 LysR family transcriptional regulator [Burkholderia sp. JKS000303]
MLRTGLGELTTFITIAEQRSFSGAARILGVSPSALSHAIRHLEARLGVRLFNRTTRSVALTEAGEQLLLRVRPAVADLEDAMNDAATARNRPSGQIRISASESAAQPLIRHVLPGFVARYPDIHVEFIVDSRLIDIVEHGFDAGIRVREDVPRDMIAVRYGDAVRFVAVASPDYLSRHPAPATPQDLPHHRCIRFRFESGALYRWDLTRDGKRVSVDVDGPMTLGNLSLMVEAALAGIGIAWVTQSRVAEHLAAGRLVRVLPEWEQAFDSLCLYYPANRHPPAALRLFVEAVREWAAGAGDALHD